MDILEAMDSRHAVRKYTNRKIEGNTLSALIAEIAACNDESGLHIRLVTNDPRAFGGLVAHYGIFTGVNNYIEIIGEKTPTLQKKAGYYGERIVLKAQRLGLNTCWVAVSFDRSKCAVKPGRGETLVCVISVGYGAASGNPHKSKPIEKLCLADEHMPDWFRKGMEAAILAPTARNQQRFRFTFADGKVKAEATGGLFSKVDLGIVKYHFEIGAGTKNFIWSDS